MKILYSTLLSFVVLTNAYGQDINFEKKSGEFSTSNGVIAKLTDEKVKAVNGKNYYIMDATGQKELIGFVINRFQDTLGGSSVYYFAARCTALGLTAYRPNFTGMLSTYREIGEMVVLGKKLLKPDGTLDEANVKSYFESMQAENGNMQKKFSAINDSLSKLINIPAAPIERNKNKEVIANEFGKIGQGNVAIGTWEFIESTGEDAFKTKTYHFRIKNSAGGIICISWIELSGAHTYIYKNGVRSAENWTLPDLINNNPIHHKENYVVELSRKLISMGLL
jgi:hypothetical protein